MSHVSCAHPMLYPCGTIIACSACGGGLYKMIAPAPTAEIILAEGSVLIRLNRTIPKRNVRDPFVCPLCNQNPWEGNQVHTLQHGWNDPYIAE